MTLPEPLQRSLAHRVGERQRTWRAPAVVAGVVRSGELAWTHGVGTADVRTGLAPDADTAFAIGSISKTFTAVLVLALRDSGALSLADPVARFLPTERHASLTVRELLAHASGLQREPLGDVWDTLVLPPIDEVVATLDSAEQVLPARRRWHYSNLAFALLGEVVSRVDGRPWAASLRTRLLEPLGLSRTSLTPSGPAAVGYYSDPFTDQVRPEPWPAMAAFSAAGGLWSTVSDLARWASFLATGADGVLAADTLEEMSRPEIMVDLDGWTQAWGLGLQLVRSGDRVYAGHSGGMPGFSAGLMVRRADQVGAVVLVNSTAGADATGLAVELAGRVLDDDPPTAEPWRPGPPVPAELAALVGRWWSEGSAFAFSVVAGRLQARLEAQPATKPPAVFEAAGPDRYRTISGREEGEWLRVERTPSGEVARLFWAGYPFTRGPRAFGD